MQSANDGRRSLPIKSTQLRAKYSLIIFMVAGISALSSGVDLYRPPGRRPFGAPERGHTLQIKTRWIQRSILTAGVAVGLGALWAQEKTRPSSFSPVVINESFDTIMKRMSAAKAGVMKKHLALLEERYDLSNKPAPGVTMSRNKPVQQGVRVKLPAGVTWDQLAKMTPEEIKERGVFPAGFLPLPHPNHGEGGMLFPKFAIDELKKQENRDLTRFDLDFDTPDHFLPEFPPPIFLTTRPDLGDVSQGKLVTIDNFYELFNGILNPKQTRRSAPAGDTFPTAAIQPTDDRRTNPCQPRGELASIATRTAIPTARRTWLETSVPRSSGIASILRRFGASTCSVCSVLSARSRPWKILRSSSSAPHTSMAIR